VIPATLMALLVAAQVTTGSGAPEVHVRVSSAVDGRPLSGAAVTVGEVSSGRTDDSGAWGGTVPAGRHRVVVKAIGFQPRDTTLVVGDSRVEYHVGLTRAIVPLSEIIVTAARREQRLADAVVETEVITSDELRRGPPDLAAILTERVGIQPGGGVPAGAGVQLRGFTARRVLILLDGLPLVGRINGVLDLSRLPVSSIERIEIVKGPQSTLYGSDAIGGVINLISRAAPRSGSIAGISTSVGSRGRRAVDGDAGWRHGSVSTAVDVGYSGVDLVSGLSSDQATYSRRGNAGLRGRWDVDSTFRFELGALSVLERQRYRTGQLFHFGDNIQSSLRLAAYKDSRNDRINLTLAGSAFDHLSRAATRDVPASDSGARDRQRLVQAELNWNAIRGPALVDAGVAVRREWIDADRLSENNTAITGLEPFAQVTLPVGRMLLTPGARVSLSDRWGEFVAPRVALLYRPNDGVAVRASLGRGFRAPDFKELYLAFVNDAAGYAVYGNPGLRPERSATMSLGAEWTGATAFVRSTAFTAAYRDFIETLVADADGAFTYGNVARGWTRGIEGEAGFLLRDWRIEVGGEHLWTRDEATGRALFGRAPFTARGTITGPVVLSSTVSLRTTYVSRTPISLNQDGETGYREAFPQLGVRLSRPIGAYLHANVEISNVLDRRPGPDWPGFTGRSVSLSLRWRTNGHSSVH
jgi:outer membrane receptor for ferrienterochelin and colicins